MKLGLFCSGGNKGLSFIFVREKLTVYLCVPGRTEIFLVIFRNKKYFFYSEVTTEYRSL